MNEVERPRLVATDLDGTLLDPAGRVTARTRDVLEALDDLGVPVVFTTGRPLRWMEDLWSEVGGHGLAICSNGGIVYDVAQRAVRDFRPVPRQVGMSIADIARRAVPGTSFAIEHIAGWASEIDFPTHPDDRLQRTQGDYAEIYRDDVVKILAVNRAVEPEEFWHQMDAAIGDQVVTTWSSSFSLVEISAKDVTKATALMSVANDLGVAAADVIAFGDMPNDLAMLEWAGTSYAMANGHQSVRDLAHHLAPGNDEDGVAVVLSELFDLSR